MFALIYDISIAKIMFCVLLTLKDFNCILFLQNILLLALFKAYRWQNTKENNAQDAAGIMNKFEYDLCDKKLTSGGDNGRP